MWPICSWPKRPPASRRSRCARRWARVEVKGPHRLRSGLVVVQVALAVVLLTGAAFTVESFLKMLRADWGFRSERVLAAHLFLSQRRYPEQQQVLRFEENLRASLSHLPG